MDEALDREERRLPGRETNDVGRQLRQYRMFLDSYLELASADNLDEVFGQLVSLIARECGGTQATIFLYDARSQELYSRVALGSTIREIRFLKSKGVAGDVFNTGTPAIVSEPAKDPRFNAEIDEKTGLETKNILCAPIRDQGNRVIGVAQCLNKKRGDFTPENLSTLEALCSHAAFFLKSSQISEMAEQARDQEMEFLDVVSDITSRIDLSEVLERVMSEATRMLDAERSTLFLNDEKTGELWALVSQGVESSEIRFPNHLGIAGAVFTSNESVNIPYAYADLRFNPAFDKATGFFTRSILCVPVVNKEGKTIGVTQVLNKKGGTFTQEDESRLKAFTAQVSVGLENAKLFNDVQNMKNYNENMLESMTNGVITLDEEGLIITCNTAGQRILQVDSDAIVGQTANDFFGEQNAWLLQRIEKVTGGAATDIVMDAELVGSSERASVNVTILPLSDTAEKNLGTMIMMEDITNEKRIKSTMSRYMDPSVADQVLDTDQEILGGKNVTATILFSDIRGFTTLTEELGPQQTVAMLNEYFTLMVKCIQDQEGMLDKFIGDAIMAAFGIPLAHEDDEDRAVRASIEMIRQLKEWNRHRAAQDQPGIDMGIGLNTDAIVSGNIGSPRRMDYTMIGDGVNLASRLESACKQYHARILISGFTFNGLKGAYRVRPVDRVVVKGKTEPVDIYEVLDYHDEMSFPNLMDVVGHFKEGVDRYRRQDWDNAIRSFEQVHKLNDTDHLADLYLDRCRQLKSSPPGDDWNGVWVLKSK